VERHAVSFDELAERVQLGLGAAVAGGEPIRGEIERPGRERLGRP
jgi:hypothetical protein